MPDGSNEEAGVFEYRYTREQALRDGVLVDLTDWSGELGFVFPVACTAAVWNEYLVPHESLRRLGHSERTRGHDLLWVLRAAVRRLPVGGAAPERLTFDVMFLLPGGVIAVVRLKAVCGPGDRGEPVITVMLPDED